MRNSTGTAQSDTVLQHGDHVEDTQEEEVEDCEDISRRKARC